MMALGFWLLVVRLAVGVLFALQLTGSGAPAHEQLQPTEGYIGTSDHWGGESAASLRGRAARSARLAHNQEVAGSNPALATAKRLAMVRGETPRQGVSARHDTAERLAFDQAICALRKQRNLGGVPGVATVNGTRQGAAASGNVRALGVATERLNQTAGGRPACSAHPTQLSKRVVSAQQKESTTRLASEALSASGSAPAQPDTTFGVQMGERLELRPLSITGARRQVKLLHRHLPKVVGGLFASSVYVGDELAGVALASEPKAPALRGRRIVEITRCATDGSKNACSKLYGALCRAAGNIGYTQARTYTRLDEPGTSLRAAGFIDDGLTREESWDRPSRKRGGELSQVRRWVRVLGGAA